MMDFDAATCPTSLNVFRAWLPIYACPHLVERSALTPGKNKSEEKRLLDLLPHASGPLGTVQIGPCEPPPVLLQYTVGLAVNRHSPVSNSRSCPSAPGLCPALALLLRRPSSRQRSAESQKARLPSCKSTPLANRSRRISTASFFSFGSYFLSAAKTRI